MLIEFNLMNEKCLVKSTTLGNGRERGGTIKFRSMDKEIRVFCLPNFFNKILVTWHVNFYSEKV